MGIQNIDKIPNKIESTKTTQYLNYEEIKPLVSKYLNITIEAIPEDNYSKIEEGDISLGDKTIQADGYQIKLKLKDVQSILTKVLESAKNDEQLFNLISKFNKDITIEEYQEIINEILTELSGEISNEENIDFAYITIYKQGKDAVKLSVNIVVDENKEYEIAIDKTAKGLILRYDSKIQVDSIDAGFTPYFNDNEFNINSDTNSEQKNIEETGIYITKTTNTSEQEIFDIVILKKSNGEETGRYNITLNRTGALTSNNVVSSIQMPFNSEDGNINIQFKNTANFSATPQFGEFTEGNHLVINGIAPEQLSNLFTNLGAKISEKLQNEMFISIIKNIVTVNDGLFDLASQANQEFQNGIEGENSLIDNSDNLYETALSASISSFNNFFKLYEGIQKGSKVKELISNIDISNERYSGRHIVTYEGIMLDGLEDTKEYKVSFQKDSQGYINKAIVKE